jgi:hypothetical protein
MVAIHSGRVKLTAGDIRFICSLNGAKNDDPMKALDVTDSRSKDTDEEFDHIDTNHNGSISIHEFEEWKVEQVKS